MNHCLFFYIENRRNGKPPFGRKRQSRNNYCPFTRKPYPNKKIEIRAHSQGKERESAALAQKDKNITGDKR